MTLSAVCVVLSGSNSTRLLRQGMAGHIVEIVGLSWIENPCGKSSRRRRLSQPPAVGVVPGGGDWPRASDAETTRNSATSAKRFTVALSLPATLHPRKLGAHGGVNARGAQGAEPFSAGSDDAREAPRLRRGAERGGRGGPARGPPL